MKKSQAATELIIVLAIAMVILLAVISVSNWTATSVSGQFESAKAKSAVNDLADAAEYVYRQGIGSRTRVFVTMPANVESASVSGNTISMEIVSGGETRSVYRNLDFEVIGSMPLSEGNYWIYVESRDQYVLIKENVSEGGVCGNDIKESGEQCDKTDLGGQTCLSRGYDYGTLWCYADCTFNETQCGSYVCSNNIAEGTEVCDGTDLKNQTCIGLGYHSGNLMCLADCSGYNTSNCVAYDTIPPTISFIWPTPNPGALWNSSYSIFMNTTITDDFGVYKGLLEWNYSTNHTMINITSNYYYNVTGLSNGIYFYRAGANDTSGNWNWTGWRNVTVNVPMMDTIPPTITVISPINGTVYFSKSVYTNASLDEPGSWCGVSLDGGANITLTQLSTTYYHHLLTNLQKGWHYVTFTCNDTSGNYNKTGYVYFQVASKKAQFFAISGNDVTSGIAPGTVLTGVNIAAINTSNNVRYYVLNNWPKASAGFNEARYILLNFTPPDPISGVEEVMLTSEHVVSNAAGTRFAKLEIWDNSAAAWVNEALSTATSSTIDVVNIKNLTSYINTPADINNFRVKFLSYASTNTNYKTHHDYLEINVTYYE